MKFTNRIVSAVLFLATMALGASCVEDIDFKLSAEQQDLIGTAVNFNASLSDPFTTKATYNSDGSFNERDLMAIYRQYSEDGGQTFTGGYNDFREYCYFLNIIPGTHISQNLDWKIWEGRIGSTGGTRFTQMASDSLTWENGKTVRFRAWSRSNFGGVLESGLKGTYYPDFSISDWVTVSGPAQSIPLELKHQGCRIGFIAKDPGNWIYKVEVCTDWEDYKREDNSDTTEHDESETEHGKSDAQAKEECAQVVAAYNRMCMPSGADIQTGLLTAMTQAKYNGTSNFSRIEEWDESDRIKYNTRSAADVKNLLQRPLFTTGIYLHQQSYMVTIPYDMSTERAGDRITLPPCTRFRIYLTDVNNGDEMNTSGYEGQYHIFNLQDVEGYENGIDLKSGYSYVFKVGYRYGHLTITPYDNLSWDQQDAEVGASQDQTASEETFESPYGWWVAAINSAVETAVSTGKDYDPSFLIDSVYKFYEFQDLVNGDFPAGMMTSGLAKTTRLAANGSEKKNADGTYDWFYEVDEYGQAILDSKGDTTYVSNAAAEARGYVLYKHFYPGDADHAAYYKTDYIKGGYQFYDENVNRHYNVKLSIDIDLKDVAFNSIGSDVSPFMGLFDGQGHTISNLYAVDEYLFNDVRTAKIANLKIESNHSTSLVKNAESSRILGISIKATSTGNPIVETASGTCYVVGCIHEGEGTQALVGNIESGASLYMYGCMQTSETVASGALVGSSASGIGPVTSVSGFGRFSANYYYKDDSTPAAVSAVGGVADSYKPQQYIRGAYGYILKAKNDNILAVGVETGAFSALMHEEFYGYAPWKAMNAAIYYYNSTASDAYKCNVKYQISDVGYTHLYPQLVSGKPGAEFNIAIYKANS